MDVVGSPLVKEAAPSAIAAAPLLSAMAVLVLATALLAAVAAAPRPRAVERSITSTADHGMAFSIAPDSPEPTHRTHRYPGVRYTRPPVDPSELPNPARLRRLRLFSPEI